MDYVHVYILYSGSPDNNEKTYTSVIGLKIINMLVYIPVGASHTYNVKSYTSVSSFKDEDIYHYK